MVISATSKRWCRPEIDEGPGRRRRTANTATKPITTPTLSENPDPDWSELTYQKQDGYAASPVDTVISTISSQASRLAQVRTSVVGYCDCSDPSADAAYRFISFRNQLAANPTKMRGLYMPLTGIYS